MNRRDLLVLSGAALLVTGRARANRIDYTPGLVSQRLAAGETVLLDFFAEWCSTCHVQERRMDELRDENPAYDAAMTFIRVDWDTYGRGDLAQSLHIPRRSTLVLLRGDAELGRIDAGTRRRDIRALMDLGLG